MAGLFNFLTSDIAIDLGTANTLIIWNDKVVVDEPSIVAKDIQTGKVVAIGRKAQQMHGKTHKLIETVRRRKHVVPIAQVILAELTGAIAARLQKRGDGGVFLFDSLGCARKSNLGETSSNRRLTRDERRATSGATLLAIPISKERALFGDAINVGRLVAHHALVVCTDVELTDVVTPNHQDVGLLTGCLGSLSARRHGAHADGNGHERSD